MKLLGRLYETERLPTLANELYYESYYVICSRKCFHRIQNIPLDDLVKHNYYMQMTHLDYYHHPQ